MPRSRFARPKVQGNAPCLALPRSNWWKGLRSGRPFNERKLDLELRDGQGNAIEIIGLTLPPRRNRSVITSIPGMARVGSYGHQRPHPLTRRQDD